MPPIRKFSRDDIINTTYNLVKSEGLEAVNARRIAKELHCSIQPIFHNFKNMEELNQEVYQKIYATYQSCIENNDNNNNDKLYKKMGISYIKFAYDYPEFFKILFMQETNLTVDKFLTTDILGNDILKIGQTFSGLSYEEQKKFHFKVWIFTHGIACLVATKTIHLSEAEIDELLESTVREMLKGYLKKEGEEDEKCY